MDKYEIVDMYMDNFVHTCEGERGVRELDELCETLGYGEGFMRGRAIEEMLIDNPGAVEAVVEFLKAWALRNDEWTERMREVLEDEGLLEEGDYNG